jgi:hypothetical protein
MPPLDFLAKNADPSPSLAAWDKHVYFHQIDWMPEQTPDSLQQDLMITLHFIIVLEEDSTAPALSARKP